MYYVIVAIVFYLLGNFIPHQQLWDWVKRSYNNLRGRV